MNRPFPKIVFVYLFLSALAVVAAFDEGAKGAYPAPTQATRGMVVTSETLAAAVGQEILESGGNAVDAAVAVGFALAVTFPNAGNLGGGGFMLIHGPDDGPIALDFREVAPRAATADMYLDDAGEPVPGRSSVGHLAAAVPGTVAGLSLAAEKWGTLPLKTLVKPAIELAKDGIPVDATLASHLKLFKGRMGGFAGTAKIFYPGGEPLEEGATLVQKDLAQTLKAIGKQGRDGFYKGDVAQKIVAEMQRGGGVMTAEDLASYTPVIREPVKGSFKGYDIYSMPPPSSGGIHLIQMLNILEPIPLAYLGSGSAQTFHLMAEAMKRAYADRSVHLGDPAFFDVPQADLIDKGYAGYLRTQLDAYRATPSADIKPGNPKKRGAPYWDYVQPAYLKEGEDTTHYSVVDGQGTAVSVTYTLNFPYGNGVVVEGGGFFLNNEMDDFSMKPGVPNAYGLIGGEANAIAPGKRPLSSMTPTIVTRDGAAYLVTGSPGGSRIITTTLQVILNVLVHQMDITEAVSAPRVHHQWLPDVLSVEPEVSPDTRARLGEMGHSTVTRGSIGDANSILIKDGVITACSDPRREGLAAGY